MGLYDSRCMITGVSLKGADAALVLLQPAANGYVPISLAIKGYYNRLGSIDGIEEDANTRLVLRYILDRSGAGAFQVNEQCLAGHECFLSERGLNWRPTDAGGQDYTDEMRQYLDEARRAFADSPTLMAALDRYENEVGDLLADE